MSEVLNLEETCDYLRLAKSTIYKYVRVGEIPAFKVGRVWRFKREMLDQWMRSQTESQTSAIIGRRKRK